MVRTFFASMLGVVLAGCQVDLGVRGSERGDAELSYLADSVARDFTAERQRLETRDVSVVEPSYALAVPDSVSGLLLRAPVSIDGTLSGSCVLAISDYADDAVHVFTPGDAEWRWRNSITGGLSDTSFVRGPGAVSVAEDGALAVTSFQSQVVSVLEDGELAWQSSMRTDSWSGGWTHGELAIIDERVVDHWFRSSALLSESIDWSQPDLPLFRVHTRDRVTGVGGLPRGDRILTAIMARGRLVVVEGGELLFGRAIDATVHRWRPHGEAGMVLTDSVRLPLAFDYVDAVQGHYADGSVSGAVATDHLLDVTSDGTTMVVLQAFEYPDLRVDGVRNWGPSRVGVVLYDMGGAALQTYELRGISNPRQITMSGGDVFLLADGPGGAEAANQVFVLEELALTPSDAERCS